MTDSDRIKELIAYLKLNANKFSASIGIKSAGVYQIISGKYKISADLADKIISKYKEINYDWLRYGKGEMLSNSNENSIPPPNVGTMGFESVKIFTHLEHRIAELKEENKWLKRQIELKDEQIKHFLNRGGEVVQPSPEGIKKSEQGGS